MLGFELFICTILFGIFYEEFRNIAHYMAFNWLMSIEIFFIALTQQSLKGFINFDFI